MPTGAEQEGRVFTAAFRPGDRTVFHTHRAPVTVYVLEGEFTLEMADHPTACAEADGSPRAGAVPAVPPMPLDPPASPRKRAPAVETADGGAAYLHIGNRGRSP